MNLRKRVAATVASAALLFGGTLVGAPASQAVTVIGSGVVEIYGPETAAACIAQGYLNGKCSSVGAGVVVNNPWSNNEVLTVDHVVQNMTTVYVRDPFSGVVQYGYIQHHDSASDLAVLWINKNNDAGGHFVASDYTFATAPMSSTNISNGELVQSVGSSNVTDLNNLPNTFAYALGDVVNNNYNGPLGTGFLCGSRVLYNVIQTTFMTHKGDSGGALVNYGNPSDPNNGTVVGLNVCSATSAPYNQSEAIQIGWAYWDMLHTFPTGG